MKLIDVSYVTYVDADSAVPDYLTWKKLVWLHVNDLAMDKEGARKEAIAWLMKLEGIYWIRGRHSTRSKEWAALMTARALGNTISRP